MTAAVLGPTLIVVCVLFAVAAAAVYRLAGLGGIWTVPVAAARAAAQLAAIAAVLATAMTRLWSSAAVLMVMFIVAVLTAAGRSQADRGRLWLTMPLATGVAAVIPALLLTGLVPLTGGAALIPTVGIILGGSMTAVAVAARRSLDTLATRNGEVEAALSLGLSERDSRRLVIERSAADACCPMSIRPARPVWSPCLEPSSEYCWQPARPPKPARCRSSSSSGCC